MFEIIDFISGNVPGGFLLLISVLLSVNLLLFFLKSSLFSAEQYRKNLYILNISVLAIYIFFWFTTKPAEPPKRIIILPTQEQNKSFRLSGQNLLLSEFFALNSEYIAQERHFNHHWNWMYKTLGEKKARDFKNWIKLAKKIPADFLIYSFKNETQIKIAVVDLDRDSTLFEIENLNQNLKDELKRFPFVNEKINLSKLYTPTADQTQSKIHILNGEYQKALNILEKDTSVLGQYYQGYLYVLKGLKFKFDTEKAKYIKVNNPDFNRAKSLLIPLGRDGIELAGLYYLLGRIALREQNFADAEVFFKQALARNIYNADAYFGISYLLPYRIKELGLINSQEVLEKALEYNPGFRDAAYELAYNYFHSGSGVEQGRGWIRAMKILENYLNLRSDDPKLRSLLASIYFKTGKISQAEEIFLSLKQEYPNDSDAYYNLGAIEFSKKDYPEALQYFEKAIDIDDNTDAYLYAAIVLERLGEKRKALKYYQQRVRKKNGESDVYAKEAMLGIKKIREELGLDSTEILN